MKFTPEQVIEMAREADPECFYPDEKLFDDEVAFLERLCALAADRALEAAAVECGAKHANGNRKYTHADECIDAIRAMKEHQ